jgi:hypothetical protein
VAARAWLWAFVGVQVTVYQIAQDRGFRTRWRSSALLRRCRELVGDVVAGRPRTRTRCAASWSALVLRADRDAGTLDASQLAAEVQGLEAAVDRLVAGRPATRPTAGCWPDRGRPCHPGTLT